VGRREVVMIDVLHATNALRLVRRRCKHANARPPLATSTESVSCHTEENLGVDQWYKSVSRSPPATAVHVRKNFLAAGPHTPPASKLNVTNSTSEAEASRLRLIALARDASF
jgi:hypothetical protein